MFNKLKNTKETIAVNRMLALTLIFTLTFSYWVILASLGKTIAASIQDLELQGTKTNSANVEFDAYFENNTGKTHQIVQNLSEKIELTLDVEVKQSGY